ncbi:MAG TPA: hypothetical protein VKP69_12175, partial [Isosphaeraceae bacterium]|nr:hypothetical protein [Isosphaeraceae bacterium]
WLLGLMTVLRLIGQGIDPVGWSVARARDAVRQALRDRQPRRGPRSLDAAFRAAVKEGYPGFLTERMESGCPVCHRLGSFNPLCH